MTSLAFTMPLAAAIMMVLLTTSKLQRSLVLTCLIADQEEEAFLET